MIVYRIGKTKFATDLTGEGARLHGGRWNHKLTPCIYTSESRALAILEYTVNINIDDVPRALSITTYEIPDYEILRIITANLPGDWRSVPAPSSTKDFGTRLFKSDASIIRVPSTVVPEEYNYILNPLFAGSTNFNIIAVQDFIYDVRIKLE